MKKILAMVAALSVVMSLVAGGTIAYLTDTESAKNVMTMGNVDITQNENFTQNSPLLPNTSVTKEVTVTNTGKTDAYVRTFVAFEKGKGDIWEKVIEYGKNNTDWTWGNTTYSITVGDVEYEVLVANYNEVLPATDPDTTTPASLTSVSMKASATNDDVAAFGNEYTVLVLTQAVQTAGFADATAAFTGAFEGEAGLNDKLIQKWFGGAATEPNPDDPETPAAGDDDSVDYEIPADAYRVTSSEELKNAINDGKTSILLAAGEYNWSGTAAAANGKTLNLYGENKAAILYHTNEGEGGTDYDFDGATVNFYGLTISGEKNGIDYPGWARMSATYNDCVFKQTYGLYGATHKFEYCTFDTTGDQYSIWTWGAQNAEFNYCTFNTDGKAILLYGGGNTALTLNNCLFTDKGGLSAKKAAVEVGSGYGATKSLTVNNTTVNGYEINDQGLNTGSTLWGNKNSMTQEQLNVVVDGVDVY